MQHHLHRIIILTAVVFCISAIAWAFSTGPINGVTGAPGEQTCDQAGCHNSFPLNSGPGTLAITVSPQQFTPGDTVTVSVALAQTGQSRWGFEATVLDQNNQPIGQILVTDTIRTQDSLDVNGRTYIKHTLLGTDAGTFDTAPGWSFKWASPLTVDQDVFATFWVAGNAANNNLTSLGDYIYTDSVTAYHLTGCSISQTGDVNTNGSITSSDIIYLVGYVFKAGPAPLPCPASGDVNCNGSVTSSDIIYLVGYVFKAGPAPCDVCPLIPGTWTCP